MVRFSNLELIKLLEGNGRASYSDLARKLGVSDTAVKKRMRSLENSGLIRGYMVDADPRKLGFAIHALTGVDTEPQEYLRVIRELKDWPENRRIYSSSGDHMIMCDGWFVNNKEIDDYIQRIEATDGVTKVCPAIILERIK